MAAQIMGFLSHPLAAAILTTQPPMACSTSPSQRDSSCSSPPANKSSPYRNMNDAIEALNANQSHQTAAGEWVAEGAQSSSSSSSSSSKGAACSSYSGAVAQRALYGSNKRRVGGRKVGGKDAKPVPSRLSKVSAAENAAN